MNSPPLKTGPPLHLFHCYVRKHTQFSQPSFIIHTYKNTSHTFQSWFNSYSDLFAATCSRCNSRLRKFMPPICRDFSAGFCPHHDSCKWNRGIMNRIIEKKIEMIDIYLNIYSKNKCLNVRWNDIVNGTEFILIWYHINLIVLGNNNNNNRH